MRSFGENLVDSSLFVTNLTTLNLSFDAVRDQPEPSAGQAYSIRFVCLELLLVGTDLLVVGDGTLLSLNFRDAALDVGALPVALFHARNPDGSIGEKVVHLLKGTLGGLRQEAVEEYCVGQVADLRFLSIRSHCICNRVYLRRTKDRISSQCFSSQCR